MWGKIVSRSSILFMEMYWVVKNFLFLGVSKDIPFSLDHKKYVVSKYLLHGILKAIPFTWGHKQVEVFID